MLIKHLYIIAYNRLPNFFKNNIQYNNVRSYTFAECIKYNLNKIQLNNLCKVNEYLNVNRKFTVATVLTVLLTVF